MRSQPSDVGPTTRLIAKQNRLFVYCLPKYLGREASVDVIANFIIRNPDVEDLIAAKMGSLLSTSPATSSISVTANTTSSQNMLSQAASLIPDAMSMAFAGLGNSSHKMVLVVNTELNMGRGKIAAQVAHAALGLYLKIQKSGSDDDQLKVYQWLSMGQKKIVLKADDLRQIRAIQDAAEDNRIPTILISDAGCTQIAPGSKTVLALFGTNEELDKITGSFKLL